MHLLAAATALQVPRYIGFGSIASRVGGAGQADYAAANGLLTVSPGLTTPAGGRRSPALSTGALGRRRHGCAWAARARSSPRRVSSSFRRRSGPIFRASGAGGAAPALPSEVFFTGRLARTRPHSCRGGPDAARARVRQPRAYSLRRARVRCQPGPTSGARARVWCQPGPATGSCFARAPVWVALAGSALGAAAARPPLYWLRVRASGAVPATRARGRGPHAATGDRGAGLPLSSGGHARARATRTPGRSRSRRYTGPWCASAAT